MRETRRLPLNLLTAFFVASALLSLTLPLAAGSFCNDPFPPPAPPPTPSPGCAGGGCGGGPAGGGAPGAGPGGGAGGGAGMRHDPSGPASPDPVPGPATPTPPSGSACCNQ